MNDLHNCLDKLKNDKRLQDWNLKTGKLTKEELQKQINALPDLSSAAVAVDIEDNTTDSMDN